MKYEDNIDCNCKIMLLTLFKLIYVLVQIIYIFLIVINNINKRM